MLMRFLLYMLQYDAQRRGWGDIFKSLEASMGLYKLYHLR